MAEAPLAAHASSVVMSGCQGPSTGNSVRSSSACWAVATPVPKPAHANPASAREAGLLRTDADPFGNGCLIIEADIGTLIRGEHQSFCFFDTPFRDNLSVHIQPCLTVPTGTSLPEYVFHGFVPLLFLLKPSDFLDLIRGLANTLAQRLEGVLSTFLQRRPAFGRGS